LVCGSEGADCAGIEEDMMSSVNFDLDNSKQPFYSDSSENWLPAIFITPALELMTELVSLEKRRGVTVGPRLESKICTIYIISSQDRWFNSELGADWSC